MRSLPLLLILFFLFPLWGLGGLCHAQSPDTLIVVPKLPYPKAKIWPPERNEQKTEAPRAQRASTSPLSSGEGPGERYTSASELSRAAALKGRSPSTSAAPKSSRSERLQNCIKTRHARLLQADLTALQETKKGAWLKYLPSVSAGLAPNFRQTENGSFRSGLSPTLSIGLNSSLLYTAHRDKQQRAAAREAIIKRSQLLEDQELAKLHRLQRRLQIETDKLTLQDGVADIDRQLFTLYQKQYDNHDISPEEYLLKRKAFLLQELRNQDQLAKIQALQTEIEELAGCLVVPPEAPANPTRK